MEIWPIWFKASFPSAVTTVIWSRDPKKKNHRVLEFRRTLEAPHLSPYLLQIQLIFWVPYQCGKTIPGAFTGRAVSRDGKSFDILRKQGWNSYQQPGWPTILVCLGLTCFLWHRTFRTKTGKSWSPLQQLCHLLTMKPQASYLSSLYLGVQLSKTITTL